jgi:tetratricopeptide (TPR) repeat protein
MEAERYLWECVRLCQQMGERRVRAFAANCLGRVAIDKGEYGQARQLVQQAFEMFQEVGVPMGIAYSQRDLGVLLIKIGAYDEARQYLQESLMISQEMGDRRAEAVCLNKLGQVTCLQTEYEQAEQLHQECLAILDEIGQQSYRFDCLIKLGRVAFDQGQYERAKQLYEQGLAGSRQLAFRRHMANALSYLGQVSCILDRSSRHDIRSYFHQALQISTDIQSTPVTLEILVGLAIYLSTYEPTDKARAIEILALAQHHPASSQDTQDRAARFLAELEAECSPAIVTAAIRRGQACDLQATVEAFLTELALSCESSNVL